ncbi:hypothetical protein GYMLUDRAFT_47994 [Collybiopsis luxurians FD-317 M1]|uniref:GATA-type domain-containing protein n=1 Tax=Collybiopsis luxurians FD-317 M1 TaxID=944289 RepID=A0A0D0AXB8_9AGAR|nr:hypothetical protein GYMLUDRAFT_47994 [Collybiopsis luxurians FD-317 M1]
MHGYPPPEIVYTFDQSDFDFSSPDYSTLGWTYTSSSSCLSNECQKYPHNWSNDFGSPLVGSISPFPRGHNAYDVSLRSTELHVPTYHLHPHPHPHAPTWPSTTHTHTHAHAHAQFSSQWSDGDTSEASTTPPWSDITLPSIDSDSCGGDYDTFESKPIIIPSVTHSPLSVVSSLSLSLSPSPPPLPLLPAAPSGMSASASAGVGAGTTKTRTRRSNANGTQGTQKMCSHCHATTTPLWRRDPATMRTLCNACGLYLQQRNKLRPQELIDADLDDEDEDEDDDSALSSAHSTHSSHSGLRANGNGNAPGPECSHCHTRRTSVWRRSKSGAQLCNACGVYVRLRGRDRPLSLKRNKIKPRTKHAKVKGKVC